MNMYACVHEHTLRTGYSAQVDPHLNHFAQVDCVCGRSEQAEKGIEVDQEVEIDEGKEAAVLWIRRLVEAVNAGGPHQLPHPLRQSPTAHVHEEIAEGDRYLLSIHALVHGRLQKHFHHLDRLGQHRPDVCRKARSNFADLLVDDVHVVPQQVL